MSKLSAERVHQVVRRWVGLCFLASFAGAAWQFEALAGPAGLAPAALEPGAVYMTLALGGLGGLLVALQLAPGPSLAVATGAQLSLAIAAPEFFGWRPDDLLVQVGLVMVLLEAPAGAPWAHLLLRVLLAKVYFEAGLHKVLPASGEEVWLDGTAMATFFETTAVPGVLAWHAHHLPAWWQQMTTWFALGLELGAPLLILGPWPVRLLGFLGFGAFQLALLSTGNYGLLPWLLGGLSLVLVARPSATPRRWPPAARALVMSVLTVWVAQVGLDATGSEALKEPRELLKKARIAVPYTMFFRVEEARYEWEPQALVGTSWVPVQIAGKVGPPEARPRFVGPYHPRLPFWTWFAATGLGDDDPDAFLATDQPGLMGHNRRTLGNLLQALCVNPGVMSRVLAEPAPAAPSVVRLATWRYRFTTPEERAATGRFWERTELATSTPWRCARPGLARPSSVPSDRSGIYSR